MSNTPNQPNKITMYECPSELCDEVFGAIDDVEAHVNDEHKGEWKELWWPDAGKQ